MTPRVKGGAHNDQPANHVQTDRRGLFGAENCTPRQRHKRGEVWHKLDNGDVVSGTFLLHRGLLKVEAEGARRVEPVGDNDPLQKRGTPVA